MTDRFYLSALPNTNNIGSMLKRPRNLDFYEDQYGDIDAKSRKIVNLGEPVLKTDAVSVAYLDKVFDLLEKTLIEVRERHKKNADISRNNMNMIKKDVAAQKAILDKLGQLMESSKEKMIDFENSFKVLSTNLLKNKSNISDLDNKLKASNVTIEKLQKIQIDMLDKLLIKMENPILGVMEDKTTTHATIFT